MKTTTIENVQIEKLTRNDGAIYMDAACGKIRAFVGICGFEFRVITKNASHRAWGGMGKGFQNFQDALNYYKSPEMKAIITTANGINR